MTEEKVENTNGKIDYKKDNISLFVGTSIGRNLEEDMHKAQSSVIIVSPYVSESKVDELIGLSKKGVKIDLYLSESKKIEQDEDTKKALRKLIKPNKKSKTEIKKHYYKFQKDLKEYSFLQNKKKTKLKFIYFPILMLILFFLCFLVIDSFTLELSKNYNQVLIPVAIIFILIVLFKILLEIKSYNKNKPQYNPIYKYDYYYIKNVRVYYTLKNKNNSSLIHAKYYIIDNKVVYTGSLNFTENGFYNNLETCIKLEDETFAKQLTDYTNTIFKNCKFQYRNSLNDDDFYDKLSLGHAIYNSDNN